VRYAQRLCQTGEVDTGAIVEGSGHKSSDSEQLARHVPHLKGLSVGAGMLTDKMSRHTTFRFCLDPTVEQHEALARHAGAARFAFNQCLRMVTTSLSERRTNLSIEVPWTGFDLINGFNAWKKTEAAGRILAVDSDGVTEVVITGLSWRHEVCQQVFEEAAVDLGKARPGQIPAPVSARASGSDFRASRRELPSWRRFGYAIGTRRAADRRSGLATTIGLARSRCLVSDRSGCTMTLAGCGACWPTAELRFCSPPSPSVQVAGGCR
jgi:Helix-turn-helix domain